MELPSQPSGRQLNRDIPSGNEVHAPPGTFRAGPSGRGAGIAPATRSPASSDEEPPVLLGRYMSKKLSSTLCYSLLLSIMFMLVGFLELAVRAFVSAGTENYVLVASFAVLAVVLTAYFTLRRPLAVPAIDSNISRPFQRMASEGMDRRRPLLQGQERPAIVTERRQRSPKPC